MLEKAMIQGLGFRHHGPGLELEGIGSQAANASSPSAFVTAFDTAAESWPELFAVNASKVRVQALGFVVFVFCF